LVYSLGNISFDGATHILESESVRKESNLTPMPLFGFDSNQTDVFDFGGATRTITLSCVHIGTPAEHATFWTNVLSPLVNGNQATVTVYISTLLGTLNVKIMDIDLSFVGGDVRRLRYTIKLIESSTIG
jgi:hypothetical protein